MSAWLQHFLGSRLAKAAALVFAAGWAPLVLVILLGPADANPIGLGLLAWLATMVALLMAAAAAVRAMLRR